MQLPEEVVRQLLLHFSRLTGRKLASAQDLAALPSRVLLELAHSLPDNFLPALVGMLKGVAPGIFQKLLGEHEEENRDLSQEFFHRYSQIVLEPEETSHYNALFLYLPKETLDDLVLVESRQSFFLRQEIETINEWMWELFGLGPFAAGAQEEAWEVLWSHLLRSRA
ncbi:MAG: hypothetical protein RL318_115 [Fibrobacterota bacterium]|jgi:hypothetical protein